MTHNINILKIMQKKSAETKLICKIKPRDFWCAHLCVRFYNGFPWSPTVQCFQFSGSFSSAKKIFFHLQDPNDFSHSTSLHYSSLGDCTKTVMKNTQL